jgi:hypothetical protein
VDINLDPVYTPQGSRVSNKIVVDGAIQNGPDVNEALFTGALVLPAAVYLMDSYRINDTTGTPSAIITGLDHLEGLSVVCWADGISQGTFTVMGGRITLTEAVEISVTGLSYTATFKSTKLAYADTLGTALTQVKRIDHLGLVLKGAHHLGLQYGKDGDTLFDLVQVVDGDHVLPNFIHCEFDQRMQDFGGEFDTDSRLVLVAQSPLPCTVLGVIIGMETEDNV